MRIRNDRRDPAAVDELLRGLPEWFGIESSIQEYVEDAAQLPTYLAESDDNGTPIGALLLRRHFPRAAEVHLMAVARKLRRHGVGRALLETAETDLARDGVRWLQVKTLGPSRPDAGYAETRAFYEAMGFDPLEELTDLWPENPCLLMVKRL